MLIKRKPTAISALAFVLFVGAISVNGQGSPPLVMRVEPRTMRLELPAPSYLGVQTENVGLDNFLKYNLAEPRGVAVTDVVENSPAKQAGLKAGDVILRFDGEQVKSVIKLMRLIEEVAPDQKARIVISRGGSEQELNVTLGKRPVPQFAEFRSLPPGGGVFNSGSSVWRGGEMIPIFPPRTPTPPPLVAPEEDNVFIVPGGANLKIGASVQTLSEQLGDYFGATNGKGLLVTEVRENRPAAKAGLKAGDVIVEVAGTSVTTRTDLILALNKKVKGDVSVTILRDKQRQTLQITTENAND